MDDSFIIGREEQIVSYEDAVRPGQARILFMGPRRSGKSSIERVIFHKMSPHETLFLESTNNFVVPKKVGLHLFWWKKFRNRSLGSVSKFISFKKKFGQLFKK